MADTIKLRVTRAHHTHQGVTYRAGETFDGTERLLTAFGDRLEPAALQDTRDKDRADAKAAKADAAKADAAEAAAAEAAAAEAAAAEAAAAEAASVSMPTSTKGKK